MKEGDEKMNNKLEVNMYTGDGERIRLIASAAVTMGVYAQKDKVSGVEKVFVTPGHVYLNEHVSISDRISSLYPSTCAVLEQDGGLRKAVVGMIERGVKKIGGVMGDSVGGSDA